MADFILKQKVNNFLSTLTIDENSKADSKAILNEKNTQINNINYLKKDIEREYNEKVNELNDLKNKFEKLDKVIIIR